MKLVVAVLILLLVYVLQKYLYSKYWDKDIIDTDYVITTRELAMLFKEEEIKLDKLKNSKFDKWDSK